MTMMTAPTEQPPLKVVIDQVPSSFALPLIEQVHELKAAALAVSNQLLLRKIIKPPESN